MQHKSQINISLIYKWLLKFRETKEKSRKYSEQPIIDKAKLYKDHLII